MDSYNLEYIAHGMLKIRKSPITLENIRPEYIYFGHFEANNSYFYLISVILTQIGLRNVGRFRKYYRT